MFFGWQWLQKTKGSDPARMMVRVRLYYRDCEKYSKHADDGPTYERIHQYYFLISFLYVILNN